jgi:hypothetical protein
MSSSFVEQAALILDSHLRVIGRPLLVATGSPVERARALHEAPVVVLSCGTGVDPCFNYGNLTAQTLFELDEAQLLALPARLSAEPALQAERQRLLDSVATRGYIDDYAGVRISRTGRRFRIAGATVWNLIDEAGRHHGQAAAFADWTPL